MKNLAYWWLFLCLQVAAFFVAYKTGIIATAIAADISLLSLTIIFIHFWTTLWIGYQTWRKSGGDHVKDHTGWMMCDVMMALGMMGTIIGFIAILVGAFTGIDSTSAITSEHLKTMIYSIASGMGTALWTTLFGLVSSTSLKIQMNNMESVDESNRIQ